MATKLIRVGALRLKMALSRVSHDNILPKQNGLARTLATTSSRSNQEKQDRHLVNQADKELEPPEVEEEEIVVSKFSRHELLPEVPITSLDLVRRIDKVEKVGSFSVDIFTGSYDEEFLLYPEILDNRNELKKIKEQAAMVDQMFPQIWDDLRQLQKYNFFNLFQLSVTEMMTVFESIGMASRRCYSSAPTLEKQEYSAPHQIQVSRAIISLISRNCLTYWPIFKSDNPEIKDILPQKHILFGGSVDDKDLHLPVGFCWTETAATLGSLPPQEWFTEGKVGSSDVDYIEIVGKKNKILYEESIENYLVFYRDSFLSQRYLSEQEETTDPNPASDPFVGCCLVDKSQIKTSPVYFDSAGCQYVDVDINTLVHASKQVFPANRKDPTAVNIKALGQLATCSVVMGILKDTLRMTYKHLLDSKKGLLDCDIIERKLTTVTTKIFAIESMIYYIAGMYDGLKEGFDAHMETTILKIVTNDYAYECLRELQHICGSDMFIISKIQDQINIFDSFLDGNIYNRLYLSTMGVIWFARSQNIHLNRLRLAPWYPGYFVKNMMRERCERLDLLTLNSDIYGNLHPSLKEAAIQLEYIVKRVRYATEMLCMRHGKDITGAQSALYTLAQLSIDSFILTSMCARASKSYCIGSRNAEIDIAITTSFARDLANEVRLYMESINTIPVHAVFARAKVINELNLKMGGYYAESPLDPNV